MHHFSSPRRRVFHRHGLTVFAVKWFSVERHSFPSYEEVEGRVADKPTHVIGGVARIMTCGEYAAQTIPVHFLFFDDNRQPGTNSRAIQHGPSAAQDLILQESN